MNNYFTKTNLYRWMLAVTVAGFFALPLLGSGGMKEWVTSLAAMEDETDGTLAHVAEAGALDVDWTLASKDRNEEDETNWPLA